MSFNQEWKIGMACPYVIPDMANRWVISDTHFFHERMLDFDHPSGVGKCRPEFDSMNHMNYAMVERWNAVVKPGDKVRHLGDVTCGVKNPDELNQLLGLLHGRKDLIIGNHDPIKSPVLQKHFCEIVYWKHYHKKVYGVGFYLSHFPNRLDQIWKDQINIHGHTHYNMVPEKNYINVCVEHTNYAPVHIDEILSEIRKRGLA